MDQLNIRQGADVRSVDDEKLGRVVGLQGNYIVVEKGFFFPTDYYIPTSAVSSATDDTVYLSVDKDHALNSGWDQMGTTDTLVEDTSWQTGTTAMNSTPASGTVGADYATAGTTDAMTGDVLRVPVHEEELTATKRSVEQGQVRIEKDVVAEERTLEVPVTDERVTVTRRTVDREGVADGNAFTEGTIEVPVRGEEVDVQKRVRVAEEVEIGKEAVQRTESVTDTVRREEVHVADETTGTGTVSGS